MKKTISIPEGVSVEKKGQILVVTGPKGSLQRELVDPDVEMKVSGEAVEFSSKRDRRKINALTGTFAAHLNNMITGVTKGFEASLKVVYSHFPMKVSVEGSEVVIQNFLGERSSRRINILEGVEVQVKKDDVTVSGINKEDVGQTAGRIEKITTVKGFDRRVFQDGIHLVSKTHPMEA
ncbi:MAG: 50S ribosomal protein L6 [Candidatus Aenigmarchaeota archaeon]|nr:50S ribosomal protein L6 [Candidatus Aenigmarchaeota archaeon]